MLFFAGSAYASDTSNASIKPADNIQQTGQAATKLLLLQQLEPLLVSKKKKDKQKAIQLLAKHNDTAATNILQQLLDGQLYYHKKSKKIYSIAAHQQGASAIQLDNQQSVVIEKKRAFKRVRLNNALRVEIRQTLAVKQLSTGDTNTQIAAVKQLLGETSTPVIIAVKQRLISAENDELIEYLQLALAIADARQGNQQQQLAAISVLAESLEKPAYQALQKLSEHKNKEIQTAALAAIGSIDQKAKIYQSVETLYFGLSLGSVLVLAGIGLAITFGVMGVINMAHGELIMIGAYTTWMIQQLMPNQPGLALILSIPAAFMVSGLVGIAIERGVIRHLYGRPLETLLATFGISLLLQQTVRSIFSPLNRAVESPEWMSGMIEINPLLSLTQNRLYIMIFCLLVFAALVLLLKKTPLGLQVRAVSQNRAMAQSMGVKASWVDALTFGLGSGVAGIAGVALSQLSNVGPNMGQGYIIDAFMVVVFGGVGNLWGTLVAGMSLGVANKLIEPMAGAMLAKILILVLIILFIQKRPQGLFPQRGRAAEH